MNDNVVLTGSVSSALESTRAADLAASFAGDPKKVVNMLSVAGGEQVMLKVRIAEMDRQIAKQFGVNLAGVGHDRRRAAGAFHRQSVRPAGPGLERSLGRPDRPGLHAPAVAIRCTAAPLHPIPATTPRACFKALETGRPGAYAGRAQSDRRVAARPRNSWPAANSPSRPAATSRATSRSSSSSSASACPSRRWCCRRGRISLQLSTEVSELTNTGAFTLQGGTASSTARPARSSRRRHHSGAGRCAAPKPRSSCRRAAASPSPA